MDPILRQMIPPFDGFRVFVEPWTRFADTTAWIVLMGFLVTATCGVVGVYLLLRRLALVGDAISHSVLPGLAIAFLFGGSLHIAAMFSGAVVAGLVTTWLIEFIHTRSRVKTDAAIGITFCSLFAFGVILVNVFAGSVHLDTECVLYGEISHVPLADSVGLPGLGVPLGPLPVVVMAVVAVVVAGLVLLFYKELLVSSFDADLAASMGFNPRLVHYLLMSVLSIVVVASFEAVGAILVIAMLILPGATAILLSTRLPRIMALVIVHAGLSALGGFHLGTWLNCSIAGAMVVVATLLFGLAWFLAPGTGLVARWRHAAGAGPTAPPVVDGVDGGRPAAG